MSISSPFQVLVVHGEYDYITNAVGGLNWMVTLHGAQNYGKMLDESPSKTLGVSSTFLAAL